jgi:kinetochore protein NDC80
VNSLFEVHKKREEYAVDIEKFLDLVSQLKEHQSELQTKVSTLTSEKSAMQHQMEELSQNIQRTKAIIDTQELSVDDARKMERHKVRLEEQLAQKQAVLEGHLSALKEANEKYVMCLDLLTRTAQHYNAKGVDLELIPETAKNAKGKNLEVRLNEDAAHSLEGLLDLDVRGAAIPHMKQIAEGYKKETIGEKRQNTDLKERMELVDAASQELDREIEVSCRFLGGAYASCTCHSECSLIMHL